jgi:hypothetical protein
VMLVAISFFCLAGCQNNKQKQNGVGGVAISDWDGFLEFQMKQQRQDRDQQSGALESDFKERVYRERIGLSTDGYVYHPHPLDFTVSGLFGLVQQDFDSDATTAENRGDDDGRSLEFDLSADILKEKKYPTTIFGRRYEALEPRPYFTSEVRTTTEYGLLWRYLSEKMPTSFQVNHSDVDFDPLGDSEISREQRNDQLRFDTGYIFSSENSLSLTAERRMVEEDPFNIDYDVDEVRLTHKFIFGAEGQHRLDSDLYLYDQEGTTDLERTQLREVLNLKHWDTLKSWYLIDWTDRTQGNVSGGPDLQEESNLFSGTLAHSLYESLISRAGGYYQIQDFRGGTDIDQYEISTDFQYRKLNSLGVLTANLGLKRQQIDQRGSGQIISVIDEAHTFNDPLPIILSQPNIILGSIVITNQAGTLTYLPFVDYTVSSFGNRVEIFRVPTGLIANGQTVLIDYDFTAESFKLNTQNRRFGIRQNFGFGLSPYYRIHWQNQFTSPSDTTATEPEDITSHLFGLEYMIDSFRASAEYENRNSTTTPYESVRVSGYYSHQFDFGATGGLNARWMDIDYESPNEREATFFTVGGDYRHPIGRYLSVEGAVRYLDNSDTINGDDNGIDVDMSLEWIYRQTEIRITYEHGRFENDFSKNDSSVLYLQIKRSF